MKYPKLVATAVGAAMAAATLATATLTGTAQATSPHAGVAQQQAPASAKPTVVLVHGAWADAAGWTPVVEKLQAAGYPVVAPPNPLRGLTSDAAYIHSVVQQIKGPVILVGHSYGGAVITDAAVDAPNVKALVYIAAFAPDQGDSLATLNGRPEASQIPPVPANPSSYPLPDGTTGTELTIDPVQYPTVFLNNLLKPAQAQALAVEQRPLSVASATQPSGTPAWKTVKSWYMVAKQDDAIAPNLERFMASRAGAQTVEVDGPHLIMLIKPEAVTDLIEKADAGTAN
ncbi:alpha/beta fold hydrolase [Nocardia stercoris]|uniref:Alpha/beta hydrolase n=1 Tax=Nocardia stercoris TaxID=2483361 RepID=A0A3M2KV39_9NOCA|nr:alpha/beta hydrolase [Nocardia stercoris]RMI29021.1 alpha/beta hydrolase [Nocardia stercoris]